jgi:hypothetical protein
MSHDKDLFHIPPEGEYTSGQPHDPTPDVLVHGIDDNIEEPTRHWYQREGVVLPLVVAVFAAGSVAGVILHEQKQAGKGKAPAEAPAPERKAPAGWDEKMAKAETARKALASRYSDCEITDITDTQTSQKLNLKVPDMRGLPQQTERTARNEVHMTIKATKTPAAMQAEEAYADGTPDAKIVKWYPFSLGASTDIIKKDSSGEDHRVYIPRTSKATSSGNTETFSVTMFPRTDKHRTTSANVSLYTHLETYNPYASNGSATHVAMGRITCGDIHETTVDGKKTWILDPKPENPIPSAETTFETCRLVPVDPNATSGMSTKECS